MLSILSTRQLISFTIDSHARGVFNIIARTVFFQSGYQRVFSEGTSQEKTVISLHSSYDPRRGVFKRLIIDLLESGRAADEFHFWRLADAAQAIWVFFKDVNFVSRDRYKGVLIAKEPRRGVDLRAFLDSEPAILKE